MKNCCYCGAVGVESERELKLTFLEMAIAQGLKPEGLVVVNGPGNPVEHLRPYGPDGALTCYDCAMKLEHRPTTDAMVSAAISSAVQRGTGRILLDDDGIHPDFSEN